MAAPELVIANAPYKKYPGGVIVLRAADWMGAARGTLSSESDARSASGTVVRDSQEAASAPFTTAEWASAGDTLTIDLGDLPLEDELTRYMVLASVLIEGDWDAANGATSVGSTQEVFAEAACQLAYFGDSVATTAALRRRPNYQPRGLGGYRIIGFAGTTGLSRTNLATAWSTYTLHWKALRSAGCTTEYLIDQIYLVPSYVPGTAGGWNTDDFEVIPGAEGTFGMYNLDPADGPPLFIDGADGGDDQGKFTWHPIVADQQTLLSGTDGGGDYQRVSDEADAEYMARVIPDLYFLQDSETDTEKNAHCYGIHGPHYIPEATWVEDDFARSISDGNLAGADNHFVTDSTWGLTPQGFAWARSAQIGPLTSTLFGHRYGTSAYVDGSQGVLAIRNDDQEDAGQCSVSLATASGMTQHASHVGATIQSDNLRFAGSFTFDLDVLSDSGGSDLASVDIEGKRSGDNDYLLSVYLYPTERYEFKDADGTVLDSGSNPSGSIAWRVEVLRYRLRFKIWDAGGAEPGTWNYDGFRAMKKAGGAHETYDYADDLEVSIAEADVFNGHLTFRFTGITTAGDMAKVFFDNIEVVNDPIGDQASAFASIEQPEGVVIGEVEMPDCQHLVYWGTRDWTALDFGSPYLDFSAKVWNDPAAAELQRSEAIWWWFRSSRPGGIVSMNWRSGDRPGVRRVLVGDG